ncbi:MAG: ATP-binding protein [Traorella sp.]
MNFYGREDEKRIIFKKLDTDMLETILVFGRRRIGKSELIKHCIHMSNLQSIYYECKQTSEIHNVNSLSNLISEKFNYPRLAFSSMEEILEFLFKLSINQKLILVLDEYSYLKEKVTGIDSILQGLIDKYKDTSHLKLVLCGSYVDIMKSLIMTHNPLYGRITQTINLKAMDYYDSSKFYSSFSNEEKVKLYSVFGGIPYYNQLINPNMTVEENIIELIASPNARLELEVSMYLKSEIAKIANANEVFDAMAKGYSKYSDILSQSNVSSAPTLVDVLDKLIKMELVEKETPINDENNKRKARYIITDNLTLFFYKYIFRYNSQLGIMDSKVFYEKYIKEDFETQHIPKIFENICKQYLIRMNKRAKLEVPFEKIGKYYYDDPINKTNGEFDIVTLDSKGYIFYEAKYKNKNVNEKMIEQEINQVEKTGMNCYKYGFFSKNGFEEMNTNEYLLYNLDDLYKENL